MNYTTNASGRAVVAIGPPGSIARQRVESQRGIVGDTVRLYGFPGTFTLEPYAGHVSGYDFLARSNRDETCYFGVSDKGIVEINGEPVPLLSAPVAPPAADYPHVPQFGYSDGPQSLGQSALEAWRATQSQ